MGVVYLPYISHQNQPHQKTTIDPTSRGPTNLETSDPFFWDPGCRNEILLLLEIHVQMLQNLKTELLRSMLYLMKRGAVLESCTQRLKGAMNSAASMEPEPDGEGGCLNFHQTFPNKNVESRIRTS